jgi:hypothetical protein
VAEIYHNKKQEVNFAAKRYMVKRRRNAEIKTATHETTGKKRLSDEKGKVCYYLKLNHIFSYK